MKISIRAARVNAGLSQGDAAEKLGVHKSTISNWEREKTYPNAMEIKKICEVYGVPYDMIIFLKDDNA